MFSEKGEGGRLNRKDFLLFVSSVALAAMLFCYFNISSGYAEAVIGLEPPSIEGTQYAPGSYVNVSVFVEGVTDLRVVTFNISFDPTVLEYRLFMLDALDNNPHPQMLIANGFIWFNITYELPITTISPCNLVNFTFFVPARGRTPLDMHDTLMLDSNGDPIPHTASDGYFDNYNPYDLNQDGKVDTRDLGIVGLAFGSYPGAPNWNPIADVNNDGYVDMVDMALVASHFGEY